MRSKIGFGTGLARGATGHTRQALFSGPSALAAARKFANAQAYRSHAFEAQELTALKYENAQTFHPLHQLAVDPGTLAAGDLHSVAVAPINVGLVFCVGSHPAGSPLLGVDLVSRNAGTLLAGGNLAATNADHGTWRCLESTSLTNGGAYWPSTTQLRSADIFCTIAFHGAIDSFGAWAQLLSVPFADGTWVQPWMALSFRRRSTFTPDAFNLHFATGSTEYSSVKSDGGYSAGEHWFVVTRDGQLGEVRFYADGELVGGALGAPTTPVNWGANQPVVIFNRSNSSPDEGADGRCYTMAVWNRVLSATEIASLVASPRQMFNLAETIDLTATKFQNAQAFRAHQVVDPNTVTLIAAKFVDPDVFRTHSIVVAPPPGGGSVGPIETVDGNSLQVTIDVETQPRQTWIGYGWGVASPVQSQWTSANLQRLCQDMGASVVRYFTPENQGTFNSNYSWHWNLVKNRGIDTIFSSSFVYRIANPIDAPPNINAAADGIDAAMDSGINPSNGWWATLQNEPDGNPNNTPTNDGVTAATQAQIRQHHVTFRSRLNSIGRSAVNVLGLEWRHPETMITEFDSFNPAGLYDDNTVQGMCHHIYNKGATDQYFDQRALPERIVIFSTETGDNGNINGNMSSPYTAARFISGVNNGNSMEIQHAAIGGVDGDGKVQVLIDAATGVLRTWYAASRIISSHLVRGTVMRLCRSSDRPTNPTMPANQASRMYIDSRTCLSQPRQFVACGRRADGRWVLVANNFAYDSQSQTTFAGGHYAAQRQQLTVDIAELAAVDRVWDGRRATRNGVETGTMVNMRAGRMRFTLEPAETLAITMRAS